MIDRFDRVRPARIVVMAAAFLVAAMTLSGATASATTPTPFNKNLVRNGGAEAGSGGDGNTIVDVPHWKHAPSFTVVHYGVSGFPAQAESSRIGGGEQFFSCGPNSAGAQAHQRIPVHGHRAAIDAGQVKAIVSVYIAVYGNQNDAGWITVDFYGAGSHLLHFQSVPIVATHNIFNLVTGSIVLPAGTNAIKIRLHGDRDDSNGGSYCDAYFDKVSIALKPV